MRAPLNSRPMAQPLESIRFSLRRVLAIFLAVAAVGAIYVAIVGPSPVARLFGGLENMAIVREASRVEAYRVVPPEGSTPVQDDISPFDFEVAGEPATLPAEMAKEMAASLLSPNTYRWGIGKACG